MTKKTTKKVVKKPAARKAAPKAAAKPVLKTTPVATAPASTCTPATCCGGKKGHWLKKVLLIIVVFALGYAACFFCPKKPGHGMMRKFDQNGCLMMERIKCPMLAQKVMAADLDNDGCITRQEFRAWKKSVRGEPCPYAVAE